MPPISPILFYSFKKVTVAYLLQTDIKTRMITYVKFEQSTQSNTYQVMPGPVEETVVEIFLIVHQGEYEHLLSGTASWVLS